MSVEARSSPPLLIHRQVRQPSGQPATRIFLMATERATDAATTPASAAHQPKRAPTVVGRLAEWRIVVPSRQADLRPQVLGGGECLER